MEINHIGTIAIESEKTNRELKSIGGISGYILELINYSILKNIKVGFIGKIYNYKKSSGINYIQVQKNVSSTNLFLINLFLKSLLSKVNKSSIIHAHRPDHLAAFLFFKKRNSVITLHGQQAHTVNIRKGRITRFIYKMLESYAFNKTNALIAVDSITQEFYSTLYPQHKNKILTISTGVNTTLFYPMDKITCRLKLGLKNTDKVIIYVGRVEPPKRLDLIIEAFSILSKEDNSYKLIIVGDGVSMKDMELLTSKHNLKGHVFFLGVRKRIELPELFSAADVSILISGNEGSPLSVKESLACGIPVVANNVGDIPEVISNFKNGFIVSTKINEIAEKLKQAVNNSSQLKKNCVNSIQNYSIEKVSQKVLSLYKEILSE